MKKLIDRFPNGKELYEESPVFNRLVHCIYHGMSLYEALSIFAEQNLEQQKAIRNLIDKIPTQPIIIQRDDTQKNI